MWVMEKFKNQKAWRKLLFRCSPFSSAPPAVAPLTFLCVLWEAALGSLHPPGRATQRHRARLEQSSPPAAGVSPRLPTRVPGLRGGAAGERQRSLRWSPCAAARGLRSGRGRDGLEMGLVAKNYECVSVCVCIVCAHESCLVYSIV